MEPGQSDALSLSAGVAVQVRGSDANFGVVEDPKLELPTAETLHTEQDETVLETKKVMPVASKSIEAKGVKKNGKKAVYFKAPIPG